MLRGELKLHGTAQPSPQPPGRLESRLPRCPLSLGFTVSFRLPATTAETNVTDTTRSGRFQRYYNEVIHHRQDGIRRPMVKQQCVCQSFDEQRPCMS